MSCRWSVSPPPPPYRAQADLRDAAAVAALFAGASAARAGAPPFDAVIHFAALKSVGESLQKPLDYYENNIAAMLGLLRAMDAHGVKELGEAAAAALERAGRPAALCV